MHHENKFFKEEIAKFRQLCLNWVKFTPLITVSVSLKR